MDLADEIPELKLPKDFKREIKKLDNGIHRLDEEAKDSGQTMEDRLYEYHDGIENFRFVRAK